MKYVKPQIKTFTNDELSEIIMANACSSTNIVCSCGGNHCPGNGKKSNSNARKRAGMAALKAIPVLFQVKIKRRLDSTWRCILKMST